MRLVLYQKAYTSKEERDVLSALGRGLRDKFPNPERVGCPGREVISAIAGHRMPLPEAQKYLDHLGACSPCYRDFLELQAKYRQRRNRMVFAVAASILIVVGLATWAMLHQHNDQIARAVVDLRERSMARGTEVPPNEAPLEIPRKALLLEIYLPLGSAEGTYELRISAKVQSGPIVSVEGNAQLEHGVTVLSLPLNAPLPTPGRYVLQIRKQASEWVSFPLEIR